MMVREREKLTPEELTIVLSNYDLGIVSRVQEFPRGSHAAPKVLIETDRGRYLLKRRPTGKTDAYRVAFSHALQRYLVTKNFVLPHLVGTRRDNNSMLRIEDSIYEVYEFIDGEPYDQSLRQTADAGRTLAIYHHLVRQYEPEWPPPSGHYHDAETVAGSFKSLGNVMLKKSPEAHGRRDDVIGLLRELRRDYVTAARAANEAGLAKWDSQIVHSDWHPGNVLYQNDRIVGVLDYDAARIQPRVLDIANGCLQFSMVTGGRDLSTWEDRTDLRRARSFLRGYDEIDVIAKRELSAVPHLMQEALIAQAVPPILKTGTFAGLDGFAFLDVMRRKLRWLKAHDDWVHLDEDQAPEV